MNIYISVDIVISIEGTHVLSTAYRNLILLEKILEFNATAHGFQHYIGYSKFCVIIE